MAASAQGLATVNRYENIGHASTMYALSQSYNYAWVGRWRKGRSSVSPYELSLFVVVYCSLSLIKQVKFKYFGKETLEPNINFSKHDCHILIEAKISRHKADQNGPV
jgi:hypothetical protein